MIQDEQLKNGNIIQINYLTDNEVSRNPSIIKAFLMPMFSKAARP
jgi:hypothetical protein